MAAYVPGALGALFSGGPVPQVAKSKAVSDVPVSKPKAVKRAAKSEVPEVKTKKSKAAAAESKPTTTPKPTKATKSKPKKEVAVETPEESLPSVAVSKPVSDVMIIKKRPALGDALKQQREDAKQKKKDIAQAKVACQDREIFVGNLTANVRRRDVEKIFKKYGSIEKVWSRSVIGLNEKKSFSVKRKFKNAENNALDHVNFYIRFKTADDAVKALEMNGTLFHDHHLRVSLANKSKLETTHSAFVSNLPFDITDEEVYAHFDGAGKIKAVRVVRDKYSGLGKGIAYVEFDGKDGVEAAVELNDSTLKGRKIRVSKSLKKAQIAKVTATKKKEKKEKAKSKAAKKAGKKPITEDEKIAKKISKFVVQKAGKPKDTDTKPVAKAAAKPGAKLAKSKKLKAKKAKKVPKSVLAG
uniref:RNA-binding protein 34 n=1 Tax=Panagrellus redivivus TaxID=6233 RepID=A0A7E4V2G0_PANRE